MGFSVSITFQPEVFPPWKWRVASPTIEKSGYATTRKGAERAARNWIRSHLKV